MSMVKVNGALVDYDAAVSLMDEDIRDGLHDRRIEDKQEFADAYAEAHRAKFGEPWVVA